MIKAIVTDIEGTTTDIQFVHKVLFPYSREKMTTFLQSHQDKPEIKAVIADVKTHLNNPNADLNAVTQQFIAWIDQDEKIAPLKTLQGYIWKSGFEQGAFKSHIYADAVENLHRWHQAGIALYVYSSGSVQAQHLLFEYTVFGDLRPLFSGYFDTQVGGKKEARSYAEILKHIQLSGENVLFLSDVVAELDAARENQIHTVLLSRGSKNSDNHGHLEVTTFDAIDVKEYV